MSQSSRPELVFGSCALGTLPSASSPAYPLATPLLEISSLPDISCNVRYWLCVCIGLVPKSSVKSDSFVGLFFM